jgi:hypothetical protein
MAKHNGLAEFGEHNGDGEWREVESSERWGDPLEQPDPDQRSKGSGTGCLDEYRRLRGTYC